MRVISLLVPGLLSTVAAASTAAQDVIAALQAGGVDVNRHFNNTALLTSSTLASSSGFCSLLVRDQALPLHSNAVILIPI